MLRQAVRDRFVEFSDRLEGTVPWPYLDVRGMVTVGHGILCDPVSLMVDLPFVAVDGSPASERQIRIEFAAVKATKSAGKRVAAWYRPLTTIRLTEQGMVDVTLAKLEGVADTLAGRWPEFPSWPAPAQLALCSWAWGVGPSSKDFPRLSAHLARGDFAAAAGEVAMSEVDNAGVRPRNRANEALLRMAATATDPDELVLPWDESPRVPDIDRGAVLAALADSLARSTRDALAADRD